MFQPLDLDALGSRGPYRPRNRQPIRDVSNNLVAELGLVPTLYVTRAMTALSSAPAMPLTERLAALTRAGDLFATGTVAGLSARDYQHLVSRLGMPLTYVRAATRTIARGCAQAYRIIHQTPPTETVKDERVTIPPAGRAVWIRRGEVLAVHIAGNHPAVNAAWPAALALGYRVAVRPSRREPVTTHRLVTALQECGFGADRVALLPTDHTTADEIVQQADLSLIYGGQNVADKYATCPTALVNGPGRSKLLITADCDWHDHLDTIVGSIGNEGGTSCANTTAVFTEGNQAPLAEAIAQRLATLPSLPPQHDKARLPVYPVDVAKDIEENFLSKAAGTRAHQECKGNVVELGDGSAVMRPSVRQVDTPYASQVNTEMAFPCVWVAPWTPATGTAVFKNTQVLSVITRDDRLLDNLLADPTIHSLSIGNHPLCDASGNSHDHVHYLGEHLMRRKVISRG